MITWKDRWPDIEPTIDDVVKEAYHLIAITDIQQPGVRAVKRAIKSPLAKFFNGTVGMLYIEPVLMRITEKSGELDG